MSTSLRVFLFVAAALALVALILGAMVWVPNWLVDGSSLSAKAEQQLKNDVRQSTIQLLAVLGAAVGGFMAIRTYRLNRQTALTDRLQQAIEHLESAQASRRVGGILALERLARDSKADHWSIVELWTAHLAESAPRYGARRERDLVALMQALKRRNTERENDDEQLQLGGLNLSNVDLCKAVLRTAVLQRTDLSQAQLRGADLSDCLASFVILNDADLRDTNLRRADLRGAKLLGADLRGADLREAQLSGVEWGDEILGDGAHGIPPHLVNRVRQQT